jgi:hypothetical protein
MSDRNVKPSVAGCEDGTAGVSGAAVGAHTETGGAVPTMGDRRQLFLWVSDNYFSLSTTITL